MSRAATPAQTKTPAAAPAKAPMAATPAGAVPQEKIAQRAYEKWMKRGCSHGSHMQDWMEAEAEIRAEAAKQGTAARR